MTDEKLDPNALAETYDEAGAAPEDVRPGVQPVTWGMIYEHVVSSGELPEESARAFAEYLEEAFYDYNEEGNKTNGDVISGALSYWRGR